MAFDIGDDHELGSHLGGSGMDTLQVFEAGPLDFTTAIGDFLGLEVIDLETSPSAQTVRLDQASVLVLSDNDTLFVEGGPEDDVLLSSDFTLMDDATLSPDGEATMRYVSGSAKVLVDDDVPVTLV